MKKRLLILLVMIAMAACSGGRTNWASVDASIDAPSEASEASTGLADTAVDVAVDAVIVADTGVDAGTEAAVDATMTVDAGTEAAVDAVIEVPDSGCNPEGMWKIAYQCEGSTCSTMGCSDNEDYTVTISKTEISGFDNRTSAIAIDSNCNITFSEHIAEINLTGKTGDKTVLLKIDGYNLTGSATFHYVHNSDLDKNCTREYTIVGYR